MKPSKEDPPGVKRPNDNPPPPAEARQVVEDYIRDLREVMRKLRIELH